MRIKGLLLLVGPVLLSLAVGILVGWVVGRKLLRSGLKEGLGI
jgi:uncharacterized protein YneF (UPF0154 family)